MPCVLGQIFISNDFISQPNILGDLGEDFCTLSQDVFNWPDVVTNADDSYLPDTFYFGCDFGTFHLRGFE